jgi:hypothetical protein
MLHKPIYAGFIIVLLVLALGVALVSYYPRQASPLMAVTHVAPKSALQVSQPATGTVTRIATHAVASSTEGVWKTYRNDRFGFEIRYPAGLVLSSDTITLPKNNPSAYVGPYYVPGTPFFWIGTMDVRDEEVSVGFPRYAEISINPTYCYLARWANAPTSTIVINGIKMERHRWPDVPWEELFTFTGAPAHGWSAECNTIELHVDRNPQAPSSIDPQLWKISAYERILGTFRFVSST